MKTSVRFAFCILSAFIAASGSVYGARVTPDLQPHQKREVSVKTAEELAQRKAIPTLPADLPSPFNPPGFDKPERPEPTPGAPVATTPSQPPPPATDRE